MDRRWPWKKKSSDKADKAAAAAADAADAAAATLASAASQGDQVHFFYKIIPNMLAWKIFYLFIYVIFLSFWIFS